MKSVTASLLMALSLATSASGMTCTAFRSRLDDAIKAGGRRVAFPHFKIIPGAAAQPDDGGIVGLDTQLTCSDDDALQAVDVTAMIDSPNDEENLQRHVRFAALVGATLCAIEPKAPKACYADAERAQVAAINGYLRAKARGEPHPSGFDIIVMKKLDANPVVKATPEGITFNIDLTE